jgi:hypothetical protein
VGEKWVWWVAGVVEHGVLAPFCGALVVKRKWLQRVGARCSHFLFSNFYSSGLGKTNTPFGGSFI